MSKAAERVDWVELPKGNMSRVRAGAEGQRCYGGSTCLAPPQFRVTEGSAQRFQSLVEESEEIVAEILRREPQA